MKKIKLLILFVFIFVTTGCSGNYNLNINPDLSIDESVELTIDNNGNAYQETLDIFEKNNVKKENYDVNISDGKIVIEYKDRFSSIEDYILNSKVYHQLFDKIDYNKQRKYIDLYVDENIKLNNSYNQYGTNLTDFDVIQVNITNPYKVNISNAEMENENVYTWTITKNDMNKKIYMQFVPSLNKFPIRQLIVGLIILVIVVIFLSKMIKKYLMTRNV